MLLDIDLSQPDLVARSAHGAPPRVSDALARLLDECGFDVNDFVVDEQARSELAEMIGVVGGMLRVQCLSTGEERLYSTGTGSAWLASILSDLDEGHFGGAVRSQAVEHAHRPRRATRRAMHSLHADFEDTTPQVHLRSPEVSEHWLRGFGVARERRRADPFFGALAAG